MFDDMSAIILTQIHRIFVNFSFFWHWVSLFLFSSIKIINATRVEKSKASFESLRHNFEAEEG